MKRRNLLTGLAAAIAAEAAQQSEQETLYIPKAHRVQDLAVLHDTIDEFPFVELVTTTPALRITHLPVWLDRKDGAYGALYGHVARHNPQSAAIEGRNAAVIVFRGPDAYISPSWYENSKAVPTWNFAAVHVTGKLEPVTDETALYDLLSTLVARSERTYGSGWDLSKVPRSHVATLMKNITGFRLRIELVEGKFKLGQERSELERDSILRHLEAAAPERSMADFTAAFYERQQELARHPRR
jgi:transcriptional regulator